MGTRVTVYSADMKYHSFRIHKLCLRVCSNTIHALGHIHSLHCIKYALYTNAQYTYTLKYTIPYAYIRYTCIKRAVSFVVKVMRSLSLHCHTYTLDTHAKRA